MDFLFYFELLSIILFGFQLYSKIIIMSLGRIHKEKLTFGKWNFFWIKTENKKQNTIDF